MMGPVQIAADNTHGCFDEDQLHQRDYLTDGAITERTVLPRAGDEWEPAYGVAASGLSIYETPNANNPNALGGIMTVWVGTAANQQGQINYQAAANYNGDINYHVQYCLVYLENTTGTCRDVILEVGSDDGMVTLVNGVIAGERRSCGGVAAYGSGVMVSATLAAGKYVVLLKT